MGQVFFRAVERKGLGDLIESYASSYRKALIKSGPWLGHRCWSDRLLRAGRWGPLVEACLCPFPSKRPTAIGSVGSEGDLGPLRLSAWQPAMSHPVSVRWLSCHITSRPQPRLCASAEIATSERLAASDVPPRLCAVVIMSYYAEAPALPVCSGGNCNQ